MVPVTRSGSRFMKTKSHAEKKAWSLPKHILQNKRSTNYRPRAINFPGILPIPFANSTPEKTNFPKHLSLPRFATKENTICPHLPLLKTQVVSIPECNIPTNFLFRHFHCYPHWVTIPRPFRALQSPRHHFLVPAVSVEQPLPHLPSQCSHTARHTSSGPGS